VASPDLSSAKERDKVGLPLGNLTSQLFANVYMNKFDQFVKHKLKVKYYIRYADDFVFLSSDKLRLQNILPKVSDFLQNTLHLTIHPDKVFLQTIASGVDFLGWVNFPDHRVLRHTTKKRMFNRLRANLNDASICSYLGLLSYGDTFKVRGRLEIYCWLWG